MIQTSVSTKYQVVIPKDVRRKMKIKPGQKLRVEISGEQIILSPTPAKKEWDWPKDYINNLTNPWKGEDAEKYLEEERNSWD